MELTPIFSNDFATVESDVKTKFIQVTWLKHTSNTDLRAVLLKASEFARAEGITNWLFDLRNLNFTTMADMAWSSNELFPSFDLQQKHKLACVATPQFVSLMSGSSIRASMEENPALADKIELEVFVSMESAMYWLFGEKLEPKA